jgi:adenylate cyclase class 2
MKEIETKILEFDENALRESLGKAGAEYLGKRSLRRVVFDAMPGTTEQDEIIRVRTDGSRTTLTWKYRDNRKGSLDNTEEIEVDVSDFDKTVEIISKLWKGKPPYHQETMLETWRCMGVEIAICTWPLVPPFLEVEGESESDVRNAITELAITGKEIGNMGLAYVFERYGQKGKDAGDLKF